MKFKFFILSIALILISSCNDTTKGKTETLEIPPEVKLTLNGTWELKGFYNYKDNLVVDSFSNNTISRQIKMFSDSKVMWCKLLKQDSIEFFGYGDYRMEQGMLVEALDFGSNFMNEIIAEQKEFKFQLQLHKDSFEQIELDEDGNRVYSENYIRIE